jgi:hypothetical protein
VRRSCPDNCPAFTARTAARKSTPKPLVGRDTRVLLSTYCLKRRIPDERSLPQDKSSPMPIRMVDWALHKSIAAQPAPRYPALADIPDRFSACGDATCIAPRRRPRK